MGRSAWAVVRRPAAASIQGAGENIMTSSNDTLGPAVGTAIMPGVPDVWAEGPAYERFMGRWSHPLATQFVQWLQAPPGGHWLDLGCGTGSLTAAICAGAEPASVVACDPSESLIRYAREHLPDARVEFVLAGVPELPARPGGYDSITSLLALNYFPDPAAAVRQMRSLAAGRDAVVSACVWDYGPQMELLHQFWRAAQSMDHRAQKLDEGRRFRHLCRPLALEALFRGAGLRQVHVEPLYLRTAYAGFEDYWQALLGGSGPAPAYLASLDEDHRAELARRLQRHLPGGPHSRIPFTARAWAVNGTPR
jgi:SAM-dependent methyltransferase